MAVWLPAAKRASPPSWRHSFVQSAASAAVRQPVSERRKTWALDLRRKQVKRSSRLRGSPSRCTLAATIDRVELIIETRKPKRRTSYSRPTHGRQERRCPRWLTNWPEKRFVLAQLEQSSSIRTQRRTARRTLQPHEQPGQAQFEGAAATEAGAARGGGATEQHAHLPP
jgi:hypothetical protein